jgi:prevent-host-death family protein
MKTVGAFEAKTHLSRLLEEVAGGEEVLITRHGRAVARLLPPEPNSAEGRRAALDRLREFRRSKHLQGLSIQALRDEGRQR